MMPVSDDAIWRKLVNSFDELPEDGSKAPSIETIKPFAEDPKPLTDGQVFVQKVVTEMYIFTDVNEQTFGEHTFQDMVILGNMSKEKLAKLLNRQRAKREKGS